MLSEYFENTSVHGCNYIHPRNHLFDRILWLFIIITGFVMAGLFIQSAYKNWDENPVLTTLDTIAAPIGDVQFPTVIVCPDPHVQPDHWGYLETILNAVDFSCALRTEPEDCQARIGKVRKDFEFLTNKIVEKIKRNVYNGNVKHEVFNLDPIAKMTVEGVKNKNFSMKDVNKWPVDIFGNENMNVIDILEYAGFNVKPLLDFNFESCTDGMCNHVKKMITVAYLVIDQIGFGSFLVWLSEELNAFQKGFLHYNQEFCDLTNEENFLHDYFTDLSQGLNLSLYDLPAMLARPKELFNMTYESAFLHQRCKVDKDTRATHIENCRSLWASEILSLDFELFKHHPCDEKTEQNCCFGKYLNGSIETIFKVMRLAQRRGKSNIDIEHLLKDTKKAIKYDLKYEHGFWYDFGSMIPVCSVGNSFSLHSGFTSEADDCLLFEPIVTDVGICYAYNADLTTQILQESPFKEAFAKAYEPDFNGNKTIVKGKGAGEDHALDFYLSADNYRRSPTISVKHLLVGLTSSSDYFSMEPLMKKVKVGYQTRFSVQPMETVPTKDLREIPIETRKCRFSSDTQGLSRFKIYSQSACEFECHLDMAEKICRCLPWNFPPKKEMVVCDIYGNFCFDRLFKNPPKNHSCDCLPNCHDIQFAIIEKTEKLEPEILCDDHHTTASKLTRRMRKYFGEIGTVLRKMKHQTYNFDQDYKKDLKELCIDLVKNDLAIVSVTFESKKFIRSIMDRKVSDADKLALLGGTLGLFTGMSILSFAEMVFWMIKFLRRLIISK